MALEWHAAALPGLIVGVVDLAGAAVVLCLRPASRRNQRLAIMLAGAGLSIGLFLGLRRLLTDPDHVLVVAAIDWIAFGLFLWGYAGFLATLDSPLARPLRRPMARWVGAALSLIAVVSLAVSPSLWVAGTEPDDVFPGWDTLDGPLSAHALVLGLALFAYGIAVVVTAWRRAHTDLSQRRARGLLAAFLLHDLVLLAWLGYAELGGSPGLSAVADAWVYSLGPPLGQTLFLAILGATLLRGQVVRYELGVKRAFGGLAAWLPPVALVVLLVVAAAAAWGGPAAAIVGLGGIAFLASMRGAFRSAADRAAEAAFPAVGTTGHLDVRRLVVYQTALEEVLETDGTLSTTTSADLDALRRRLGVTERDHALLEHALRRSRAGGRASAIEPGERVLGRYDIVERIGRGSQGDTLLAHDRVLGRSVVLKVVAGGGDRATRLAREAAALARVRHDNVVTVFDTVAHGRSVIIVMERVPGGSLKDVLARAPTTPAQVASWAQDVLAGLSAVHRAGLLHRDVKPSNVLIDAAGGAKLADFGIALDVNADETLRLGGDEVVGTLRYMAPEVARGERATAQSDLYAVGAVVFEGLTGSPRVRPRHGETLHELRVRVAGLGPCRVPSTVPEPLGAWLARALDPEPEARFASAEVMASALLDAMARSASTADEREP